MYAYVTIWLFIVVKLRLLARKYINEHRVVHDYGLCAMVKTAQDGDLNAHIYLITNQFSSMSPAPEGTCTVSLDVPSGLTVPIFLYEGNKKFFQNN